MTGPTRFARAVTGSACVLALAGVVGAWILAGPGGALLACMLEAGPLVLIGLLARIPAREPWLRRDLLIPR